MARHLSKASPEAVRIGMQYVRESVGKEWAEAGALAAQSRRSLMATEDYREGRQAFKERRPARSPKCLLTSPQAVPRMTVSLVKRGWLRILSAAFISLPPLFAQQSETATPTFYRDILPILQARCQRCHRHGEMAPMPLETYRDVQPFAAAIAAAVQKKTCRRGLLTPAAAIFRTTLP